MEKMTAEAIRAGLRTSLLGREIIYAQTVGSTNDIAKQAARKGTPEGLVVIAEEQTSGRGRLGRPWLAPAGTCLLVSLLLCPSLLPSELFLVTALCSSGAAAAIEMVSGLACSLKWPNDLLIQGKKVGGILSEVELEDDKVAAVIVGLGLNVNFEVRAYPEIATTAISLAQALGRPVSRVALLQDLLFQIEGRYLALREGRWKDLYDEWCSRLMMLHKWVTVRQGEGTLFGYVEDVAIDGTLLLRVNEQLMRIMVGDVSLQESS
ncbi:MAG: biotin--[acetyl-CoA-carboxylase] ligase [Chloroflexi bacterium]|nr:biotin--[acetyl-CoA-carboxylase] ligase [Chloroflexota bacterium]MCL5075666.1 biotin--[acetyl-CoA-carboxylase] ligase [Chloroflexota bacterium]